MPAPPPLLDAVGAKLLLDSATNASASDRPSDVTFLLPANASADDVSLLGTSDAAALANGGGVFASTGNKGGGGGTGTVAEAGEAEEAGEEGEGGEGGEGGGGEGDGAATDNEVETETIHRLLPEYAPQINSPLRHVRTRVYFTSESHIHSLVNVLRYCQLYTTPGKE